MGISSGARVCLLCAGVVLSTSLSHAVTPDRIQGALGGGAKIGLQGNVHALAKPENDLGRADGNRLMQGVTLAFRPSPEQQKDLDNFLAELGDPASPNYHKYLTPKQFGQRFGMSTNDLNKVSAWLQSEGFTSIKVANGRNQVSFDGTVAQVESTFNVEMHHYLVDGVIHLANAGEPSIPAALAGAVVNVGGLHTFAPKPRVKAAPRFTSYISGDHLLTPADFATIYGLNSFYSAGFDGTGQKIAVVGQSQVSQTDINNFRSAAGLSANTVTMTLVPSNSTDAKCGGDETESDLDLEWSGGVAKNATIIFVYAGLNAAAHDSCGGSRANSVWNALQYAVDNNVAPFISTSYGACESANGQAFAQQVQGWAQQGQTQGQTIVGPSGDSGAADCESTNSTVATTGLAVDVPASIPEVTGAGGTEFSADSPTNPSNNPPGGDPPYWAAAGATADTVSSALEYIPETAWNETAAAGTLTASGGGASLYFAKPSWQTGTGVPNDQKRDVPDVAVNAAAGHDPYLICTEDTTQVTTGQCTSGFRDGAGGGLGEIGGTSAAAPTFAAILALINQFSGNTPPTGLAPINPVLYSMAGKTPAAFHDITTGNNMVPCQPGTTGCSTGQYGFNAGTGYDQVTGLGSVNGFVLAQAMSSGPGFSLAVTPTTYQVAQGSSVTVTVNLTPINGFTGQVTYTCSDSVQESTCTGPTTAVPSTQSASFQISTKAPTARLERPFDGGAKIFYATLFPGLLGIGLVAGSRKGASRGVRFLGLFLVLGFSTLWVASCGGSSTTHDPGTPTGSYSITITGTATINGAPVNRQVTIQLVVVS
jgi:subtilase family serine protease